MLLKKSATNDEGRRPRGTIGAHVTRHLKGERSETMMSDRRTKPRVSSL